MIKPGLISITFRSLPAEEIVSLCLKAGLEGVEWGGDVHCPHGDLAVAKALRRLCADSGLAIASYGSYYRLGESEASGLPFRKVLDSALELGAPRIRVWAGSRSSADADASYRELVSEDLRRVSSMASEAGVKASLEYHLNTLTDDIGSALLLIEKAPSALCQWQPIQGLSEEAKLDSLLRIPRDRLGNVHVFEWLLGSAGSVERRPLSEGAARWSSWLKAASSSPSCQWAFLEFTRGDSKEQLLSDAAILRSILGAL